MLYCKLEQMINDFWHNKHRKVQLMKKNTVINDLSSFITASPSPFQAVAEGIRRLEGAGFRSYTPGDAVSYALGRLRELVAKALDAGVKEHNIIVDPGVGFGTSPEQAVEMISRSGEFSMGKYPVLIGPSRKRFLAKRYPGLDVDEATAEVCLLAVAGGADIVRVHDVACVARRF